MIGLKMDLNSGRGLDILSIFSLSLFWLQYQSSQLSSWQSQSLNLFQRNKGDSSSSALPLSRSTGGENRIGIDLRGMGLIGTICIIFCGYIFESVNIILECECCKTNVFTQYLRHQILLNMQSIKLNWVFKIGCASMVSMILMGAKFGHKDKLSQDSAALFHKAQLYNLANSVGFIACSLVAPVTLPLKIAIGGFVVGQLLFTLPLYITAVHGGVNLKKLMPIGGLGMIVAWLGLLFT